MTTFPTWLTGPNGERRVFNSADEVPPGWVDGLHKSVRRLGFRAIAETVRPVTGLREFGDVIIATHDDGSASVVSADGAVRPLQPAMDDDTGPAVPDEGASDDVSATADRIAGRTRKAAKHK